MEASKKTGENVEGSRAASQRSSEEAVSEDSSADAPERSRSTSMKENQQQHVFERINQLQALEQRNHEAATQLKEAVAAKESCRVGLQSSRAILRLAFHGKRSCETKMACQTI